MARDVLQIGQVRIHSGSASREDAMREAADILESSGAVTSAYFDAMQQREETVSTYMGNELAIPHGTNETKSAILASALYGSADVISAAVPALEGPLKGFVGFIDSLRLQLDGLMQSATVAIDSN